MWEKWTKLLLATWSLMMTPRSKLHESEVRKVQDDPAVPHENKLRSESGVPSRRDFEKPLTQGRKGAARQQTITRPHVVQKCGGKSSWRV